MDQTDLLSQAPTDDLIKLHDRVEGMILNALTKGDGSGDKRLHASHRANSSAFSEQLTLIINELCTRAGRGDEAALSFLASLHQDMSNRSAG